MELLSFKKHPQNIENYNEIMLTLTIKNRYAMRTCVCYLEIIVGYVVLSYTVQNVGFVGFVWCHVCFAALKINETVRKKFKNLKDKVSGS